MPEARRRPSGSTQLSTPCLLCGGTARKHVLERDGLSMARCSLCGVVYTDPQPALDELRQHSNAKFSTPEPFLSFPAEARQAACDTLGLLKRLTGGGRLLDVGCGAGTLAACSAEFGFEATGCERSPQLAAYAAGQGIDVVCCDFLDFPERAGSAPFDVIVMSEVIEHFSSPRRAVRKARELLREGGILYLTTPNIASWPARLQRDRWVHVHPTDHMCLFSPVTIRSLLHSEHFGVQSIQSWNLKGVFCRQRCPDRAATPRGVRLVLKLPRPLRVAARALLGRLNLGSNMMVIARKL